MSELTVKMYCNFLAPSHGQWDEDDLWPADVFALAASVLQRADCYCVVLGTWPPKGRLTTWVARMKRHGAAWARASAGQTRIPADIKTWWANLLNARERLEDLRGNVELCADLLQLVATADEACFGVGLSEREALSPIQDGALENLRGSDWRTICRHVSASRAAVLPKTHTAQTGLTLRSLTHNIALISPVPVRAYWRPFPWETPKDTYNLLLLPWPREILPTMFTASDAKRAETPREFGLFTFDPGEHFTEEEIGLLVREAERVIGSNDIDGIVLPELALHEDDAKKIVQLTGKFVIAGVGRAATEDGPGQNAAVVAVPQGEDESPLVSHVVQDKHHRWCLDGPQIIQYGLGSRLHPEKKWWENIQLGDREISFWPLQHGVSFCVLICEDLARQDPIASVVRSVGPSLVVALLMDGPQLGDRWSGRYATVLSEDPGSSVLTLTSLGMATGSRPAGVEASRVVALWREPLGGATREIELPEGADGLVLSLARQGGRSWTADGRVHVGNAGYLSLVGVHPVRKGTP